MATSLFQSTLNGSTSNLPDSTSSGRSFTTPFSGQSGSAPVFHHSGSTQGLHNIHGSFNVTNMPGSLTSRNSALGGVPSSVVQQPSGSLSTGRFASNNLPVALSQLSHGGLHGHSGVTNRGNISVVGSPPFSSSMNGVGGSIPGMPPASAALGNRSAVPGLGVSPILGNTGPRLTSSIGNIVGASNVARNISSGGGLGVPALASRINLTSNSGSGGLNVQGPTRLMSGVLQQAPQMISMLGSSYATTGGPLVQNQAQVGNNPLSTLGMPNDVNSNDGSPFDLNDFPQLTGRPSSAGGPQGQLGSLRKQGLGVSSIVQQSQEFSIQNEDFPALPGFKGNNADFGMDLHQKETHHENAMSMMQPQHFPMGRSAGFSLAGPYVSHRPQQQQQQHVSSISNAGASYASASTPDLLHLHGSDLFPSTHAMPASYHSQVQISGAPTLGLRPMNNPNPAYDQLLQQYHQSNQSQFRLQQVMPFQQSYRDQSLKSLQGPQATPDRFGLLGLLNVIKMSDPVLASLALGIDLTILGLNLNSRDHLHKTFASPWSDGPAKGDPEYSLPQCYLQPSPKLQTGYFSRFRPETLLYIFYSMPNDEAQLYAANELMNQGWLYHRELRLWLLRPPNVEPLVRTHTYERGTYLAFDPNTWETVRKENFILHYEMIEKRPTIPQH